MLLNCSLVHIKKRHFLLFAYKSKQYVFLQAGRVMFESGKYGQAKKKYRKSVQILENCRLKDEAEEKQQQVFKIKLFKIFIFHFKKQINVFVASQTRTLHVSA